MEEVGLDQEAFARLVQRAASDLEAAEDRLRGQAQYLHEIAEGLMDKSIHPDHLPVVGSRISGIKAEVEGLLSDAEQALFLAH